MENNLAWIIVALKRNSGLCFKFGIWGMTGYVTLALSKKIIDCKN
jgi:hypothetical protein